MAPKSTLKKPALDDKYFDYFDGMDADKVWRETNAIHEARETWRKELAALRVSSPGSVAGDPRASHIDEADKFIEAGQYISQTRNPGRPEAKFPPVALMVLGVATFPLSLAYFALPHKTKEKLKENLRILKGDRGPVRNFLSTTGGKVAAGVAVAVVLAAGMLAFNPKQEIKPIDPERPAQPADVAGLPPSEQLPPTTVTLPEAACDDLDVTVEGSDVDRNGLPDVVEEAAHAAATELDAADSADASVDLTDEQFEEGVIDTTERVVNGEQLRGCPPVVVAQVVPEVVGQMIDEGSLGRGL